MNSSLVFSTVYLSLKIGLTATAINLPLAVLIVYVLHHYKFRGRTIIEGLINLPLIMPPVTTGYLLLFILGKKGLIGSFLFSFFGIRIAFTSAAAVIASMVVSFPLFARSIKVSIEMLDPSLESASLSLGASKLSTFFRVILPLIMPGIVNGTLLGFARCLGEFGATMTFAGNIDGETRTIPLSVYSLLQIPGREKDAAFLIIISIIISFAAMFLSTYLNRLLQRENALKEG